MKRKSLSRVRLFETPWTAAHQAPPSMGFSRQEFWSGVPSPSPPYKSTAGIRPQGLKTPRTQTLLPRALATAVYTLIVIGPSFAFHDTAPSLFFFLLFFVFPMKFFSCSTLENCRYLSLASPSFSFLNGLNSDHDFL